MTRVNINIERHDEARRLNSQTPQQQLLLGQIPFHHDSPLNLFSDFTSAHSALIISILQRSNPFFSLLHVKCHMTLDDLTLHHMQYACAEAKPPNQPSDTAAPASHPLLHTRQSQFLPVECRRVRVNQNVKSFYDRNENWWWWRRVSPLVVVHRVFMWKQCGRWMEKWGESK